MEGWPEGWSRDDDGRGAGGAGGAPGHRPGSPQRSGEPTAALPPYAAGAQAAGLPGPSPREAGWPAQPPAGGSPVRTTGGGRRRASPVFKIIAAVVAVTLAASIGMYFYLDARLTRVPVFAGYAGRPAGSAGQNWLITGSDSRQGLTRQQENEFATGHDVLQGERSDTIMLLHIPGLTGTATLVSLPRDLYVDIPGYGMNKMNAAFSFGGPKLLAETVQNYTGLRIEHYMGIGFGGLVSVVNAVGGVHICVRQALNDTASGLHLRPGCQTLDGGQALSYVRDRHSFAASDLQRVQDQRAVLKALLQRASSPAVALNPLSSIPAAKSSASALTVDEGTHLYQLARVAMALRGPQTTTVPTAGAETTDAGDVVLTNRPAAIALFAALGAGKPVPKDLLSGTSGA